MVRPPDAEPVSAASVLEPRFHQALPVTRLTSALHIVFGQQYRASISRRSSSGTLLRWVGVSAPAADPDVPCATSKPSADDGDVVAGLEPDFDRLVFGVIGELCRDRVAATAPPIDAAPLS
jgi:hypothetical protein